MVGESSKPPHGKGISSDKKDDKKDVKGNDGKPPPSPPSSSSSPSSSSTTTKLVHTHSKSPKGKKNPLLKLDNKFELPMYNGEVNAKNLENWIL